ncbi:pyrroline-5-carboxylate reductase, partial [bacterium]
GGTTEAGLKVLEDRGMRAILAEAVAAATRRAAEIREQNECTR